MLNITRLADWFKKIKNNPNFDYWLIGFLIITLLVGTLFRFRGQEGIPPLIIDYDQNKLKATVNDSLFANSGQYVASQKGKKYHWPWCPGGKSIKEENKIWFNSREDAERAGYTPAANCPGLIP